MCNCTLFVSSVRVVNPLITYLFIRLFSSPTILIQKCETVPINSRQQIVMLYHEISNIWHCHILYIWLVKIFKTNKNISQLSLPFSDF